MRTLGALLLAVAVVLVSNGAALWHVWSNRSATEAEVVLTERELEKQWQERDNSGVSLRFNWSYLPGLKLEHWVNRVKLRELGFDVTLDPTREGARQRYSTMLARPVFVALEYDGPAWQKYLSDYDDWVKRWLASSPLEAQRTQLEQVRNGGSRLIPIDAELDAATLRGRYPDASKVLVVGAAMHVAYAGEGTQRDLSGRLEPLITHLHVPLPLSRQLENLPGRAEGDSVFRSRYEIRLRFGAHREPWVIGVARLR